MSMRNRLHRWDDCKYDGNSEGKMTSFKTTQKVKIRQLSGIFYFSVNS